MARGKNTELLVTKLMFSISTLEDLGKVLSSSEDFEVRIRTALFSIMGSIPVAKGGLFLFRGVGGKNGTMELVANRGVDLGIGLSFPLPDSIKNGLVSDPIAILGHSPPPFFQDYMGQYRIVFEGLKTQVIQPLVFKNEFFGLVCLGEKFNGEAYGGADLEFLRIMANYISIGLHNHRLVIDLERVNMALNKKVTENSNLYADLQAMYKDTVRALGATIDAKDPYTRGHSDRVARFSVAIAMQMGLDGETVNAIDIASHLHDIGKIAIDNSILCKPKKLTHYEFQEMSRHPLISYDILSNIRFPYKDVALMTKHHHEMMNGSGYPDRKRGEDLTVGMKILGLADAFDAMTSDRPYRPALTLEQALEEICSHVYVQFDRDVTESFLQTLKSETQEGSHIHGIIRNMGKRSQTENSVLVIDRMIEGLAVAPQHRMN